LQRDCGFFWRAIVNSDGSPAKGVEEFFRAEGSSKGAYIKNPYMLTDDKGSITSLNWLQKQV
jgi:hypothetical protein